MIASVHDAARRELICLDDSCCNDYLSGMALKDDIKLSKPFPNPGIQAFITLGRTMAELVAGPEALLRQHGISPAQFNVLRILRGSPDGLPLGQIGERMIARDPDLTRLIDRMAKAGLVERVRSDSDRRVVLGRITKAGLKLCAQLDGPASAIHDERFARFGEQKTRQLIALLEELRACGNPAQQPVSHTEGRMQSFRREKRRKQRP